MKWNGLNIFEWILRHQAMDGSFYVGYGCKNGTDRIHIISQLTYDVTGLAVHTLNPYEFIAGGL